MRVALVHDDLVQWGGAEKVFLNLCKLFPQADIYTSLFDEKNIFLKGAFGSKKVYTSFMQKIPGWRVLYRILLPLYPIAFEQFDFSDYDLVISSTTKFAKSILTKPETLHICYCHTPPRFLWGFSGEKVPKILTPYLNFLRFYDKISSKRVDKWIAGSDNAAGRIEKVYGAKSLVCQPFVDDIFFQSIKSFDGDYYLIISRLNRYKKVDIAVNLFNKLGKRLIIIGSGPESKFLKGLAGRNIDFFENIASNLLINLISGCKALIILAEEDFGLTSPEAQAMGKPVITYKKGGALETVIDGKTGIFFTEQNEKSLLEAIEKFEEKEFSKQECIDNAKKFSISIFNNKFTHLVKLASSSQARLD